MIKLSSDKHDCSYCFRGKQNFVAIGPGVSAPQIRDSAVPDDVSKNVRFLGSSIRLQPTLLNGFLRKTSFRVRKCLLGI